MSNFRQNHIAGSTVSRIPAPVPNDGATHRSLTERRQDTRYELCLECDLYELADGEAPVRLQPGKSAEWSRRSVLLRTVEPLREGMRVQVRARWMFGLSLNATGTVLRGDGRGSVVSFTHLGFSGDAGEFWDLEVKRRAVAGGLAVADLAFGA